MTLALELLATSIILSVPFVLFISVVYLMFEKDRKK